MHTYEVEITRLGHLVKQEIVTGANSFRHALEMVVTDADTYIPMQPSTRTVETYQNGDNLAKVSRFE
jgi:hypothetical protein